MNFTTPPYLSQNISVQRVMLRVLVALLPGIAVYVWLIGPAILVQIGLATLVCLLAEAAMLKVLKKPLALFLGDGSAVVAIEVDITVPSASGEPVVGFGSRSDRDVRDATNIAFRSR